MRDFDLLFRRIMVRNADRKCPHRTGDIKCICCRLRGLPRNIRSKIVYKYMHRLRKYFEYKFQPILIEPPPGPPSDSLLYKHYHGKLYEHDGYLQIGPIFRLLLVDILDDGADLMMAESNTYLDDDDIYQLSENCDLWFTCQTILHLYNQAQMLVLFYNRSTDEIVPVRVHRKYSYGLFLNVACMAHEDL